VIIPGSIMFDLESSTLREREFGMREPSVVPMDESPFAFDVPARERHERGLAQSGDLLTDELGIIVGFSGEEDVEALLNDPRFGAVAMTILQMSGVTDGPLHDMWSLLMFGKDGEDHKRVRSTVAREFTPRAVEHYRSEIEQFASTLADEMGDAREVELWSAFALPLAARAACRVVGIAPDDADRVAVWALDLVNAFFFMSPERKARAELSAIEFAAYLDELMSSKRVAPGDDVTSKLISDEAPHDLTYQETRALVANLVFGGLEATAKVITTGVFHLLNEDQWGALAETPDLAGHAVAELLRFAPPTGVARLAREDLVCRDVQLHAGQMALLNLEGACRDARRYVEPDTLDLSRDTGRQLAFGAGAHFCLGANLAKIVLEAAFHTLATRYPTLALACAPEDVGWDYETFQGIVRLPVTAGT
jgi:cytochrome P450